MGIELIDDEDPFVVWGDLDRLRDVRNEVRFRPSRSNAWSDLFAGGDFVVGDQTLCAVTNVFALLAFDLANLASHTRAHRFCFSDPFEGLDAGLFIRTHEVDALRLEQRRLLV